MKHRIAESLVLSVALGLVVQGCSGGSSSGGGGGGSTPTGAASFGLEQRQQVSGLTFPALSTGSGGSGGATQLTRAFPNLTFQRPLFLAPVPGTTNLVVVEQTGAIRTFTNSDAAASASTYLDISGRITGGTSEEGLLGLAFDPNYTTNGFVYVHYSASGPRRSVISRFSTTSPTVADPASEVVILQVNQPFSNHNAGSLAFGQDGMLYIGMGDGGSGGDPQGNGQNANTLLGSVLRIDVRTLPYQVPSDNPFVAGGGGAGEIWATGLRNPFRFSFDRQTGALWVGDVGQGDREEVSIVTRGANLGWRVFEGDISFDNPTNLPASSFTQPVISYPRGQGTTVIGGYVYRGTQFPALAGTYFYGDHGSGRVWALTTGSGFSVTSNTEIGTVNQLSSFGEDAAGEVYALSLGGQIHRVVQGSTGGGSGTFPQQLSQTGLFSDTASLTPAAGVIEYDVNHAFWSDGARKRRWIALPGTGQIGFSATGNYAFPVGTVLVKHFEMQTTPGVFLRLETRVLIHETQGTWAGYAYQWNSANSDATLTTGAVDVPLTVQGVGTFTYRIPSANDCSRCHTAAAGHVLGIRTRQLNRNHAYPNGVTDNQLRAWNNINLFTGQVPDPTTLQAHPALDDASASLEARSRAYLAVNCSPCHQPGGPAPGSLDMRRDTALGSMNLLDVVPTEGNLGLIDPRRIRSGVKETSVLWERIRRTDTNRMPPVGSNRVDPTAEQVLGAWIDGL